MRPPAEPDWPRRLRPLTLDGEPLAAQLRRRRGVAVVASALFGGLMLFFLALFAGFGHAGVGLAIDAAIAPIVARIWAGYRGLARAVAAYPAEAAADRRETQTPTGPTPREVEPGR